MGIEITQPFGEQAEKELGMGCPPSYYGSDEEAVDRQFTEECSYGAKIRIVEEGIWTFDFPILDTNMSTFGPSINPFGTPDGVPPPGVTTATNTLATPNLPPNSMIVRGIWVAIRVEPEARTIRANVLSNGGSANMPVSPDVFTLNDVANNALGLEGEQELEMAELLHGLPTWRFAYALVKAYELVWAKNHQERLIQQPLESVANIQPFAQAEAAGLAFASNADVLQYANNRLSSALGDSTHQYLPITHKRLGSAQQGAAGANVGIFSPTREEDAAPTMFGGIGVPYGPVEKAPYMFTTPMWWPAGRTMTLFLELNNQEEQGTMQRWISATGGASGQPGTDLALNPTGANNPLGPNTATGATVGLEMTLDTTPSFVSQQVSVIRWLGKNGRTSIAMGLIGRRVTSDSWMPVIARAVASGAIACPQGYGDLAPYMATAIANAKKNGKAAPTTPAS